MREEANGFLPHLFKKRLTEFAPRMARKNSDLFFGGGVYVVKNTLRGAECRRPAYGGSRRRAERNPLVKKAAPF